MRQVFISHVYEERHVALVLQKYIRSALADAFPVFAAFDKDSIGGGKKWLEHIIENLKQSEVVLVLVSHASKRRPWLTFEAGFGIGAGAAVIPVSIRDFSLGKLEFPLAGFQGRSIDDLPSILSDITRQLGVTTKRQDLEKYLNDLREAEARMAYRSLAVRPSVLDNRLMFELENTGNSDIALLMLEIVVPRQYLDKNWAPNVSEFIHHASRTVDGLECLWLACTSQAGLFGRKRAALRPVITPAMGVVPIDDVLIRTATPPPSEIHHKIYYQIHAVDHPTGREHITWAELMAK